MGNPQSVQLAMLGLDSAGKTTVLYRLKLNQYTNSVPTVGFNCEKVKGTLGKSRGVSFTVWDVGGQEQLRPLWRSYTRSADGIIFVVDSNDIDRLEEAKVELQRAARMPESANMPILVIANKQDLPGALTHIQVEHEMEVPKLTGHMNFVQPACAITGEGLPEGLEVLYDMILKRRKQTKKSKVRH